ncbi:MAG: signal recognition particle-docking protein FtsY [Mycoplasmataceae bacterium]|nr:signal recognition particle-docking protein FtsY [Mycoplasmataceae bacterium]
MGFFSKLKSLFKRKTSVEKDISATIEQKQVIEQEKFDTGLKKSADALSDSINKIAKKYRQLDDQLIEDIETLLLSLDIGPASCYKILDAIVEEIKYQNVNDPALIKQIIVDKLFVYYIQDTDVDTSINLSKETLNVILVAGVNGVGKTTSIAKLANKYKNEGFNVCLIAADTFRAGAVAQLEIWANRIGIQIYKPQRDKQDPASVVHGGLEFAKNNNINLVICDTSGRLQNKIHLMNELKKIDGVIKKFAPTQPIESLLVLDATTGQSGIAQAKAFSEVSKITGIVLTKMDSTSKGGIVLAIKDAFNLPVKFIGLGEKLEDLEPFSLEMFIHGLVKNLDIED